MVGHRVHRVDERQPGPGRSTRGTTSPTYPPISGYYDLRLPEVRAGPGGPGGGPRGVGILSTTTTGSTGSGCSSGPSTRCCPRVRRTSPSPSAGPMRSGPATGTPATGQVLMPQEFSEADDLAHIRWLATAFADDRYIKIDGRPLMLVYRAQQLPDPKRTFDLWREEARKPGIPDLYLCWVESHGPPPGGPQAFGLDASVGFMPFSGERVYRTRGGHPGPSDPGLPVGVPGPNCQPEVSWRRFPSVMAGWDNTARRPYGGDHLRGRQPRRVRALAPVGRRFGLGGAAPRRTSCSSWRGTSGPRATTSSPTSATAGASSRPPGP